MIVALEGIVVLTGDKFVVLSVGGVSYRVYVGAETIRKIPQKSGGINASTPLSIKLWTHHHQREDSQELYGFFSFAELEFFEMLISISGVGPRSGLSIIAVAPLDTLKHAIAAGDTSYLTKVSGIGRKTAEKVVLELRDKLSGKGTTTLPSPELKDESDALDALLTLGYSQSEAREALNRVSRDVRGASQRVQAALKQLGRA